MVSQDIKEWNIIKMNQFNLIVVWIGNDRKECNENKSCLDRKKKRKKKNAI